MKTFKDLVFENHQVVPGGKQAKIFFDNGYGASVVGGGRGLYGNGISTFELAVIKGTESKWGISYDTNITQDVMSYLSIEDIDETLKLIQQL